MMNEKIEKYYNDLINNNVWPINDDEIESIWIDISDNFSDAELITLLKKFSEDGYIFRWLGIIGHSLSKISYNNTVLEIVENTIEQIKNDMAQGNFIRSLILIGETNQANGLLLYNSLQNSSELSIIYSGLVLGGIGKNDYEYMFKRIANDYYISGDYKKASYIKAIRVANEGKDSLLYQDIIIDMIEHIIDSENVYVKNEIVHFLFDFNRINKEWSEHKIEYLLNKNDDYFKKSILNKLWIVDLNNIDLEIKILNLTSKEDNNEILEAVARTLASNGKNYLETSFSIIQNWITRKLYYGITNIKYCLNELGKNNYADCIFIVKQWFDEYDSLEIRPLIFALSDVLKNIASYEYLKLMTTLVNWVNEDEIKYGKITIHVIDDILVFNNASEEVIDLSFDIFKKLSKNKYFENDLSATFFSLFGSRPLFATPEKIINIITNWSIDTTENARKMIIPALGSLAEYKIDTQETLHMTYNKETSESKIKEITVKKVEHKESVVAYRLLEKLTLDSDDEIQERAKTTLNQVSHRLIKKEESWRNRLSE